MQETILAIKYNRTKFEIYGSFIFTFIVFVGSIVAIVYGAINGSVLLELGIVLIILTVVLAIMVVYEYRAQIIAPETIISYSRSAFTVYTKQGKYVTIFVKDILKYDIDDSNAIPIKAGNAFIFFPYKTKYGVVIFKVIINGKVKRIKSFPVKDINQAIINVLSVTNNHV